MTNSREHIICEQDLPLHCPPPNVDIWDQHPRVYLPIIPGETALCPYCGNTFYLPESKENV